MALNIKNREVERLATELAGLTGESKTETIRKALADRHRRLVLEGTPRKRGVRFLRYLEKEIWPKLPRTPDGRRLSRKEEDEILGFGPEGV